MIIFYSEKIEDGYAYLSGDESIHCSKVLRNKEGDKVYLTDGNGCVYEGVILSIGKKEVSISSLVELESKPKEHRRAIAIAPTKNIDRYEWFLEKATEIGITDIYPFVSARSERKVIKPPRLEKIIISAMKQSKNYHKPTLHPLQPFNSLVDHDFNGMERYIAHCMEPDSALQKLYKSGRDAVVMIGPEGDFSENEADSARKAGWKEVSLGTSRLRTETAGIVACHLLNL